VPHCLVRAPVTTPNNYAHTHTTNSHTNAARQRERERESARERKRRVAGDRCPRNREQAAAWEGTGNAGRKRLDPRPPLWCSSHWRAVSHISVQQHQSRCHPHNETASLTPYCSGADKTCSKEWRERSTHRTTRLHHGQPRMECNLSTRARAA
jgi:hypothetical protein